MRTYLLKFLPHIAIGFFFSLFINVLQLSYILYLRLLFDKVMTSRSEATLFFLTAGVIGAYVVMGLFELVRSKLLVRTGVKFDQIVAGRVFDRMIGHAVEAGSPKHTQSLKDLNSIRNFMGGSGIFACFDAPWVPIYLAIVFLFHAWLGYMACLGALLLFLLVLAQEILTTRMRADHSRSSIATDHFVKATMRNVQTVNAMGMLPALTRKWTSLNSQDVFYEDRLAARTAFFQSAAKFIMMCTVMLIMSTGAYLVVLHEITLGTMIAASMFMGRALAPVMMLGSGWKSLVEARLAYGRLQELMTGDGPEAGGPVPKAPGSYEVKDIRHSIAGNRVLDGISFTLPPGRILSVVGPSGAGKSTLGRILLGLWRPESGQSVWGGTNIFSLDRVELGSRIGYVPQESELFSGTVAENIARMGEADSPGVVMAAREAGAHEMILELPNGYDTLVGTGGVALSGGQKQRIAWARALYGDPDLLILDEPDSHLDQSGRATLRKTLAQLKARGKQIILITHNQKLAGIADVVISLNCGVMERTSPGPAAVPA